MSFTTFIKANAPTIAFIFGLSLSAVATVEAVKATTKAEEKILEPAKREFEAVETSVDKEANPKAYKSARKQVYIKSGCRATKLYAKSVVLWVAGNALLIYSFKEQASRLASATNVASLATAALSTMDWNTRQTFGDEVANALRTGENIPEAIDNCDFDRVKENGKKKISYHSDSLREYADREVDTPVDYKKNCDHFMISYMKETIDDSYWYKNPYDRLMQLQATEDFFNRELTSKKRKYVSIKDIRDKIGYIVDDETIDDVRYGWWDDGSSHPINLGLGYLWEMVGAKANTDRTGNIYTELLDQATLSNGDTVKRDWFLMITPMGDIYNH